MGDAGPSTLRSGSAAAAEDGSASVPDAPGGTRGVSPRRRRAPLVMLQRHGAPRSSPETSQDRRMVREIVQGSTRR